jgi:hypothetical protein
MDAKQIGKIRMSVSRAQNSGARVRYSPFVRGAIEQWLRSGESIEVIAVQSGIRPQTISRWSEQIEVRFQRVEVTKSDPAPQNLVLRFASGVRISAPTVELMIETLKVLK